MVEVFRNPTLVDLWHVCEEAQADQREQYAAFTGLPWRSDEVAAGLYGRPLSWVITDSEGPVAVAGFDMLRSGVYQDWMVSTERAWAPANWRGVTRIVRNAISALLATEAHRVQCVSLEGRETAQRWYRLIGFKLESRAEGYAVDGRAALIYSKVRDGSIRRGQ